MGWFGVRATAMGAMALAGGLVTGMPAGTPAVAQEVPAPPVPGEVAQDVPAAPDEPPEEGGLKLSLSQTAGLRDGQVIEYEVTGIPTASGTVTDLRQCDDAPVAGVTFGELAGSCRAMGQHVTYAGQTSVTGALGVEELYEVWLQQPIEHHYCADEPYDCVIVAFTYGPLGPDELFPPPEARMENLSAVAIDVLPSPLVVGGPGLDDPDSPLDVWVSGQPGATLTLAQCVRFPDVARELDQCLAGPEVVLSPTGRAATELTVVPAQEVDGRTYDCRLRPCQVTLFDAAGGIVAALDIPGTFPSGQLTLDRSTDLADGSTLRAHVELPTNGMYPLQCVASVLAGDVGARQGCQQLGQWLDPGVHDLDLVVHSRIDPMAGESPLACEDDPGGCVVALGREDGRFAWYVPISFAGPAEMTLSPATGLLDGQEMTADLSGLAPGETYAIVRCWTGPEWEGCEDATGAPSIVASPEGIGRATAVAAQKLEALGGVYCRDRCSVAAVVAGSQTPAVRVGYEMAEGSVTASPATGLVDGQAVQLSGVDLMASYVGPPVWVFPSGGWSVVQCDAAVRDDVTLRGVLTHCGIPPGGGPVDVPGSTFDRQVEVVTTLDRILGGTTDCTSEPGSCVLAAARLELDGSLSLHPTPLVFADPT